MKFKIHKTFALIVTSIGISSLAYAADSIQTASVQSGIVLANNDFSVRPQDDFFRYVNGIWLKNTDIPIGKSSVSAYSDLNEATFPALQSIIEELLKSKNKTDAERRKMIDLYSAFMDTAQIEATGNKPLQGEFLKVDAMTDKSQIPTLIAWLNKAQISAPYEFQIHLDSKDTSKYVVDLGQFGLGLPDRDYYLRHDDVKLQTIQKKYVQHIEKMLTFGGDKEATKHANAIMALETELAKIQWSRVEMRNPIKAYNRVEIHQLHQLMPGYNWNVYFKNLGVIDKIDYVIVSQPSYFAALDKLLQNTSLDDWKTYFKWHILRSAATTLPKDISDEYFTFNSTTLRGITTEEARWKRGTRLINFGMGESLGKMYVAKYFSVENKTKIEKIVGNLLLAYKQSVTTLDWMDVKTKKEALAKLDTIMPKIAYPEKWRDYSGLVIKKGDPLGNLRNIRNFDSQFNLNKLGSSINRDEWGITPQTANAYYNPELNEIVVPAAMLHQPYFTPGVDDAVNYGAIGAIIGRQISYGLDEQGSQYDASGKLRDWWTKETRDKFALKARPLIKQYNSFSPIPGYWVDGELTFNENIADNAGLTIAYKAYKISLADQTAPTIDGLTGDQRFFMGYAQVWRSKVLKNLMITQLKSDFRAPAEIRANGSLRNISSFYDAYQIKEGDQMYLAPTERVSIW
ncbi:M13 family metallopeptidase [Undibacterium sp. Ji83W]|uniref:M13 family metallopeptidase n=1 Tax=Undibacterium sp. Ji83W TaxID=3413043 RepID=UPI003BF30AF0